MNEIMNIDGIKCYEKDGVAYLDLETVARGLGFTQQKHGVEYVKWERVRGYLSEIHFSPEVGKGDFIPENTFYRLAMKAKNETAEAFQAKIADEVIPSIRKFGAYMTPETLERAILNPDTMIQLCQSLKEYQTKCHALESENAQQKQLIAEYSPKAGYYDLVLQTSDAVSTSQIAKDYGKSAQWLNALLHEYGIQYNQGGVWLLYQKYAEQGYTRSRTHIYTDAEGMQHSRLHTYWTQKGRLFIYDLLKSKGIIPLIDLKNSRKETA